MDDVPSASDAVGMACMLYGQFVLFVLAVVLFVLTDIIGPYTGLVLGVLGAGLIVYIDRYWLGREVLWVLIWVLVRGRSR
jgi:hypothetical protein